MSKNVNNHTDKHTVPKAQRTGILFESKANAVLKSFKTRSIVAGATWIWITCFGGAAGRGPKNNTKP